MSAELRQRQPALGDNGAADSGGKPDQLQLAAAVDAAEQAEELRLRRHAQDAIMEDALVLRSLLFVCMLLTCMAWNAFGFFWLSNLVCFLLLALLFSGVVGTFNPGPARLKFLNIFWIGGTAWTLLVVLADVLYLVVKDVAYDTAVYRCRIPEFAIGYHTKKTTECDGSIGSSCYRVCVDHVRQSLIIEAIGLAVLVSIPVFALLYKAKSLSSSIKAAYPPPPAEDEEVDHDGDGLLLEGEEGILYEEAGEDADEFFQPEAAEVDGADAGAVRG